MWGQWPSKEITHVFIVLMMYWYITNITLIPAQTRVEPVSSALLGIEMCVELTLCSTHPTLCILILCALRENNPLGRKYKVLVFAWHTHVQLKDLS